ncbi:MAG: hypothetical protein JXB46_01695 [Candidatus Eisenbacteria bacterium]|nr:hypothetical protein [Candidatus Eisenbacteria bacterium]
MDAVRVPAVAVLAAVLVFSIAGCGKDDESSEATAEDLFQQGWSYLEDNLSNEDPGESPPWEWQTDMSVANRYFENALAEDPDHCGALLLSSLTRMLMVLQEDELGEIIGDLFPDSASRAGDPMALLLSPVAKPDLRAVREIVLRWQRDPFAFSQIQMFIEDQAIPALLIADARMTRFENADCSVFVAVDTERRRRDVTYEIDATDVYIAHVALDMLQALLHVVVSYDVDIEEGETMQYLVDVDEDFMSLRPGDNMPGAYGELVEAAEHLYDAGWSMEHETDPQDNDIFSSSEDEGLFPMGPEMPGYLMSAADEVDAALDEGVVLNPWVDSGYEPGAPDIDILIDIETLFMDPLDPITGYFPQHEWLGANDMHITEPVTLPDPTFNGITPNMTNELWRPVFDWLDI